MTHRPELTDLLTDAANRVSPNSPPTAAMLRAAHGVRRRRAWMVAGGSAAAVLVVMAGVLAFAQDRTSAPDVTPPVATPEPVEVPEGFRLVGIGGAAIAVPEDWGTNELRCATPVRNTVVIDVTAFTFDLCETTRPATVDSVTLVEGRPPGSDFVADETVSIDGVIAQRQTSACGADRVGGFICSSTLYLPTLDVWFHAEAATRTTVDEILSRVRILGDQVAVPGYSSANNADDQSAAGATYRDQLTALGLTVREQTEKRYASTPGFILDVQPAPGTVLDPGDVVTVTTIAEPKGPADEVSIGVNSDRRGVSEGAIRSGRAEIRLTIGQRIWAYASGKRSRTLTTALAGDSLAVDDPAVRNYPNSWIAVAPGRTRLVLSIVDDGRTIELGTVDVIVEPSP